MVDLFVFVGSNGWLEEQHQWNSDWFTWYRCWNNCWFDGLQTEGQMESYSPVIFNNPDKRTDLPNPLKDAMKKEDSPFDMDAIQKLKELHNVEQ